MGPGSDQGAMDIVSQSFDTMQGAIARQKIAAYPPDYVLKIPKNIYGMLEFDKAGPLISYGCRMAAQKLPSAIG